MTAVWEKKINTFNPFHHHFIKFIGERKCVGLSPSCDLRTRASVLYAIIQLTFEAQQKHKGVKPCECVWDFNTSLELRTDYLPHGMNK